MAVVLIETQLFVQFQTILGVEKIAEIQGFLWLESSSRDNRHLHGF
jgi:hypothetical protein